MTTIHINIMQQVSHERTGEKRGGRAEDTEKSKCQSKVLNLSAKLSVTLCDEYARLQSKDFPELIHHHWNTVRCPCDNERISQCRTAEDLLTRTQRDKSTAGDKT